ncbi:hypothetical protein BDK51DRAFT_49463 [Blyttiomyces helicus]|uniref:Uncharacterized protein n=1 Tax=Blyttiomyces helicus TaxID=388810 RepID=A0A4P9VWK2_9FUNG|nr:hypothetical protein BDK51DRAFT_49463 [Blyttiomyces helicus]|eukprot:RKO84074.1 hypothetical protein BDK51DRAFT_49463 [Blyttiomyces helicus]
MTTTASYLKTGDLAWYFGPSLYCAGPPVDSSRTMRAYPDSPSLQPAGGDAQFHPCIVLNSLEGTEKVMILLVRKAPWGFHGGVSVDLRVLITEGDDIIGYYPFERERYVPVGNTPAHSTIQPLQLRIKDALFRTGFSASYLDLSNLSSVDRQDVRLLGIPDTHRATTYFDEASLVHLQKLAHASFYGTLDEFTDSFGRPVGGSSSEVEGEGGGGQGKGTASGSERHPLVVAFGVLEPIPVEVGISPLID